MNLISIRFLGKTQLITEGTAIDLANQLAAKDVRPDFKVYSKPDTYAILFYVAYVVFMATYIYMNVFNK